MDIIFYYYDKVLANLYSKLLSETIWNTNSDTNARTSQKNYDF